MWSFVFLFFALIVPGSNSLIEEEVSENIIHSFLQSANGQIGDPGNFTLRGYLKSSTGKEINAGVIVVADLYDGSMAPVKLISLEKGQTYFETTDLEPGSYQVYATANAFHSSGVFQVNASEGMTVWLNITLVPMEIFTGYCLDKDGPVNEAILTLRKGNNTVSTTKTSSQGLYKIILPPGEYDLKINKVGYVTQNHEVIVGPGDRITMNYTMEKVEQKEEKNNYLLPGLMAGFSALIVAAIIVIFYIFNRKKNNEQEPEIEDFHCIKCGSVLDKGDRKCSACGYELMKRCDECGSENPIVESICIKCGSTMG